MKKIVLGCATILLSLGLLAGCNNEEKIDPDDIDPDPEIVEPGPEEDPDGDDDGDGEPEHTHEYGDWQYDETYHWKECSECGDIIDKAEHTLNYRDNDDGETHTIYCEICGYQTSLESHNWDNGQVIKEPTCVDAGETLYTCEDCGATYIDSSYPTALGHDWSSEWSYDATNHWHVCTVCGEVEPESTATHTLTSVLTNPTCTEGGYTTYTCEECGYSYTGDETNALGHSWGSWTDNNDDETHIRTCSRCNDTDTEEHDYKVTDVHDIKINNLENGNITATYDYVCTVCGHEMTVEEPYTLNFANDPWEIIDEVSTKGYASTYYNVGDTKTITIGEEEHDVRIIDFDHDTLSSNNSSYNGNKGTAAITCEMVDCLSTTHEMNSSITNSGGWYSCDMRSYLRGTILPTLDSDLQSVIKKVDKKSTAGNASTSLGTTASDSLFLLARVEVDATTNTGYKDEGTQYAYYSNNYDRVKEIPNGYNYNDWWLRSPCTEYSTTFLYGDNDGRLTNVDGYSSYSKGVSFAFCI